MTETDIDVCRQWKIQNTILFRIVKNICYIYVNIFGNYICQCCIFTLHMHIFDRICWTDVHAFVYISLMIIFVEIETCRRDINDK